MHDYLAMSRRVGCDIFFCLIVPPKISISQSSAVVLSGRSLNLQCQGTGYPHPSINWTKADGNSSSLNTAVNGRLEVLKVRLQDAGVYKCEARNIGGVVARKINVTVLGRSNFIETLLEVFISVHYLTFLFPLLFPFEFVHLHSN